MHIPFEDEVVIERYSDSATSYVVLDTSVMAVYKQLYRAAKAKSKLKLRVAVPPKETVVPVATVEDETESPASPEEEKQQQPQEPEQKDEVPPPETTATSLPTLQDQLTRLKEMQATLQKDGEMLHEQRRRFMDRIAGTGSAEETVSAPACTRSVGTLRRGSLHHRLAGAQFAVCCNSCDKNIPAEHWHCSTCEDGDFDLCQPCVEQGATCHSVDHTLAKRTMQNGQLINCQSEPRTQAKVAEDESEAKEDSVADVRQVDFIAPLPITTEASPFTTKRTCNCCVDELPEKAFLHCQSCDDYDLCQPCFSKGIHGHHPGHGFAPAVAGTSLPQTIKVKLAPGRNQIHQAICDGCEKHITGVRHKCLDCPDWDYCVDCHQEARKTHAKHRFVPIYEPLSEPFSCLTTQAVHPGICCDGPLCSMTKGFPSYIRGVRYKCAVCNDVDFCANCEASPHNKHNKTHPLIKFNTPVRHVSVTTTGEHQDGQTLPLMGDRCHGQTLPLGRPRPSSISPARTVVDVKPQRAPDVVQVEHIEYSEAAKTLGSGVTVTQVRPTPKGTGKSSQTSSLQKDIDENRLRATFVRESVADCTIFPPNHVFEQTWVLRNDGDVAWPAGCSIKYVGGSYMGLPPSTHPASVSDLVSASESTVCYGALPPGEEFAFTVLLRTPHHNGRMTSYWRLTSQDGHKLGDRLWCHVTVRDVEAESKTAPVNQEVAETQTKEEAKTEDVSVDASQMIFPKLEKESPVASVHQETKSSSAKSEMSETPKSPIEQSDNDWDDYVLDTDEEYDILDSSDEDFSR